MQGYKSRPQYRGGGGEIISGVRGGGLKPDRDAYLLRALSLTEEEEEEIFHEPLFLILPAVVFYNAVDLCSQKRRERRGEKKAIISISVPPHSLLLRHDEL